MANRGQSQKSLSTVREDQHEHEILETGNSDGLCSRESEENELEMKFGELVKGVESLNAVD